MRNEEARIILEKNKELIQAERYDEARALLVKFDAQYNSPSTQKWLRKLDAIAAKASIVEEDSVSEESS